MYIFLHMYEYLYVHVSVSFFHVYTLTHADVHLLDSSSKKCPTNPASGPMHVYIKIYVHM